MATSYIILTPESPGPFCTLTTTGGDPVAFQVPHKWAERIVLALKLLDAHEHDNRIAEYAEKINQEINKDA